MTEQINGEASETMAPPPPPVQIHFLESFDAQANIAKATGTYHNFINAAFQMAAIMLSEIGAEHVDEVIGRIAAQAQSFRQQREEQQAQQAAEAALTQAATPAPQPINETGATNVH